jgi:hypothetical protein
MSSANRPATGCPAASFAASNRARFCNSAHVAVSSAAKPLLSVTAHAVTRPCGETSSATETTPNSSRFSESLGVIVTPDHPGGIAQAGRLSASRPRAAQASIARNSR